MTRGHIFLLVGPSGGGKTTLIRRVTTDDVTPRFTFVPSTTSRPARPGERHGVDYFFADDAEFDRQIAQTDFLEWQRVHGFRYGSSRQRLLAAAAAGQWGITSADILGAFKIQAALPALVSTVFVTPSEPARLRQRIRRRAPLSTAELDRRLDRVAMEMQLAHACDHLIFNDDLDQAESRLRALTRTVDATRRRREHFRRQPVLRAVEVAEPPTPECGARFLVADTETGEQAVDRVLHQWWWERHSTAVRFDLPSRALRQTGAQRCVQTPTAWLELTPWSATCPDGRPFGEVLRKE